MKVAKGMMPMVQCSNRARMAPHPQPGPDVDDLAGEILGPLQPPADGLHQEQHPEGVDIRRYQADYVAL